MADSSVEREGEGEREKKGPFLGIFLFYENHFLSLESQSCVQVYIVSMSIHTVRTAFPQG
jgi:hypothetical protein